MKDLLLLLGLCSAELLLFPSDSQAQWQPDVRLTNDPGDSHPSSNTQKWMATNGNIVHVVFHDDRNGLYNDEIYYIRSTDGGISWSNEVRLTNDPGISWFSSIAVSGQSVHVVWMEDRDGNYEIYYKRSSDGGLNWGGDMRLTNDTAYSGVPSVSVSGLDVHVVWFDERDGNYEIYYKHSADGGINWGVDTRLTNNSALSYYPSVFTDGLIVHVIWQDFRDGNWEIYYKRSTDGGVSWGTDSRLTNAPGESKLVSMDVTDQTVYAAWQDDRDGNIEIYFKRSTDRGITWGADSRLTNNPATQNFPSLAASGQTVSIVWADIRDGNWEIHYKRSTDGGNIWDAETRLTNNPARSDNPCVGFSGQAVNVLWTDIRDGNFEIYHKRDPSGIIAGIGNPGSETPGEYALENNYPNPFNPSTTISFSLPSRSFVSLKVFDALGREVSILLAGELSAGTHSVKWNAQGFASGVYLYRLHAGAFTDIKKLVLLR